MIFRETSIAGLLLIVPERRTDVRGHFARTFCAEEFRKHGLLDRFPQTSVSYNRYAGTIRGMHYQREPFAETKLVRCGRGSVFDVIVDLRPTQPTYLSWERFELSADNGLSLFLPPGVAHGFQTLVGDTELSYSISPSHVSGQASGLRYDDPQLGILWPCPPTQVSQQDLNWPLVQT